jgi:hypothetical protein
MLTGNGEGKDQEGPTEQQSRSHHELVWIAPAPLLARLKGPDNGVSRRLIMLGGVLVFRRIAAANMPAGQAQAEMYPLVPHLETLFAAFAAGSHRSDLA